MARLCRPQWPTGNPSGDAPTRTLPTRNEDTDGSQRPRPVFLHADGFGPRRNQRVAGVSRRGCCPVGSSAGSRDHALASQTVERTAPWCADGADHGLPEHDCAGKRAGLPRKRRARASLPQLDSVERRHHGPPRPAPRNFCRWSHLHLRLFGVAI